MKVLVWNTSLLMLILIHFMVYYELLYGEISLRSQDLSMSDLNIRLVRYGLYIMIHHYMAVWNNT